jgi:hypothetical protein
VLLSLTDSLRLGMALVFEEFLIISIMNFDSMKVLISTIAGVGKVTAFCRDCKTDAWTTVREY